MGTAPIKWTCTVSSFRLKHSTDRAILAIRQSQEKKIEPLLQLLRSTHADASLLIMSACNEMGSCTISLLPSIQLLPALVVLLPWLCYLNRLRNT